MSRFFTVPDDISWECVGVGSKSAEFVVVYVDGSVLRIVVSKVTDEVVDEFVLFDTDGKKEEADSSSEKYSYKVSIHFLYV